MAIDARDMSVENYMRMSRQLLAQAQQEFNEGHMRQASAKAWGAAAQAVKATAEQRGWEHGTRGRLFENIDRISRETGDDDFHVLFHIANSLHQNSCEGWQNDEFVQRGIQRVKVLVERLDALDTLG